MPSHPVHPKVSPPHEEEAYLMLITPTLPLGRGPSFVESLGCVCFLKVRHDSVVT